MPHSSSHYIPFIWTLMCMPHSSSHYIPFIWTLMGMPHSSSRYIPFIWTLMGMPHSSSRYIPFISTLMGMPYSSSHYIPFIWTFLLTKRLEKKLDGNYTRMLRAILIKSWQQHPTRHQLYGHLPPITKTIQVRRNRHAGHCCRSRDELIRDVLLWIPTHGRANAGRPART